MVSRFVPVEELFAGRHFDAEIVVLCVLRIPMMPISQSDLMPISSERSDAGLPQSELVIGIRQDFSRVGLVFH